MLIWSSGDTVQIFGRPEVQIALQQRRAVESAATTVSHCCCRAVAVVPMLLLGVCQPATEHAQAEWAE